MSGPAPAAVLAARVRVDRGDWSLDAALEAGAGETVAVVGPNGAGKSTLLRALTGTVPVTGTVVVDGEPWDRLPTHRRRVGLVHQDHALFPHLTAAQNVAFGPRARGVRRHAADATARTLLDRVGVGDLADRRPDQLSGGQSQRVAVARALATEPRVLLLDEPFAALDVAVGQALREELTTMLADFDGVTLLVTHDPIDVFTLAGRVVVLEDGTVAQDAAPEVVAQQPTTAHAARLIGRNVLPGTSAGTDVALDPPHTGLRVVTAHEADGPVLASFAPSAVTLTAEEPTGSARNRWPVSVRRVVPSGSMLRVHVDPPDLVADLTPAAADELGLRPGVDCWASVKATDVDVVRTHRGDGPG